MAPSVSSIDLMTRLPRIDGSILDGYDCLTFDCQPFDYLTFGGPSQTPPEFAR